MTMLTMAIAITMMMGALCCSIGAPPDLVWRARPTPRTTTKHKPPSTNHHPSIDNNQLLVSKHTVRQTTSDGKPLSGLQPIPTAKRKRPLRCNNSETETGQGRIAWNLQVVHGNARPLAANKAGRSNLRRLVYVDDAKLHKVHAQSSQALTTRATTRADVCASASAYD